MKVKHDAHENFQKACLAYAFKAASAFFVLLCAQHGLTNALGIDQRNKTSCLRSSL